MQVAFLSGRCLGRGIGGPGDKMGGSKAAHARTYAKIRLGRREYSGLRVRIDADAKPGTDTAPEENNHSVNQVRGNRVCDCSALISRDRSPGNICTPYLLLKRFSWELLHFLAGIQSQLFGALPLEGRGCFCPDGVSFSLHFSAYGPFLWLFFPNHNDFVPIYTSLR